MRTFQYRAVSRNGAEVNGIVEAFDEYAAVAKIKETCSVVTKISEVQGGVRERGAAEGKIKEKNLALLCSQFAIILSAGLPVLRAVELIAGQTTDKTLKKILTAVASDVGEGFSLAKSFEDKGRQLPTTFIETVRSGEQSGTLEQSFRRLHDYYNKSSRLKGKVKSAMIYPTFTLIVAVIVVIIIMVVAVPAFTAGFADMGESLPGVTKALIAISNFFTNYWMILAAVIAAAVGFVKLYGRQEQGRLRLAELQLKFPVLGKITLMKSAAQIANTLCTLVAAGLPIIQSVSIVGKVVDNAFLGRQILNTVPKLEEGQSLGSCLRKCPYLPEMLVEMTAVGEDTGTLESTLETVGLYYDNETELASAKAVALMEPIIICILAVIVCFLLLSVYLPMFQLYGGIG